MPFAHVCPAVQARPHIPQCDVLVRVSASQPLVAFMSQSRKPALQLITRHTPDMHCGVALGNMHSLPQPLQCVRLVLKFASQPFVGLASQSP